MGKTIEHSIIEELKEMQEDIKTLALLILTSDNDYKIDKKLMEYEEIDVSEYDDNTDTPFEDIDNLSNKLNLIVTENHRKMTEWNDYLKDKKQ